MTEQEQSKSTLQSVVMTCVAPYSVRGKTGESVTRSIVASRADKKSKWELDQLGAGVLGVRSGVDTSLIQIAQHKAERVIDRAAKGKTPAKFHWVITPAKGDAYTFANKNAKSANIPAYQVARALLQLWGKEHDAIIPRAASSTSVSKSKSKSKQSKAEQAKEQELADLRAYKARKEAEEQAEQAKQSMLAEIDAQAEQTPILDKGIDTHANGG